MNEAMKPLAPETRSSLALFLSGVPQVPGIHLGSFPWCVSEMRENNLHPSIRKPGDILLSRDLKLVLMHFISRVPPYRKKRVLGVSSQILSIGRIDGSFFFLHSVSFCLLKISLCILFNMEDLGLQERPQSVLLIIVC